jgi:RNA polymerase sigma factor (TIGR02999 family)
MDTTPEPSSVPDPVFWAEVNQELRRIAEARLRHESAGHTLQPTAVVNEAFIRLQGSRNIVGMSRSAFLAAASEAIRRLLIDHARSKAALKRGGNAERAERLTLTGLEIAAEQQDIDTLDLEEALAELHALDERAAKIVTLRFYGGMSVEEVADHLHVSARTVELEWSHARSWLKCRLSGG